MPFPERLKGLLKSKGYTQQKLASLMAVSQQTVSRWVKGQYQPDIDQLIQFSQIFGVSIDYLIGITDIPDAYKNSAGAGEAARAGDPDAMPSDVKELKELIVEIVDQALATRLPPSGGQ